MTFSEQSSNRIQYPVKELGSDACAAAGTPEIEVGAHDLTGSMVTSLVPIHQYVSLIF